MPVKIARGVITPNQRYVCLSCRLQNPSLAGGRPARYQHTGLSKNDNGDQNQDFIPKDAGSIKDPASRSRISDIIRSFMFKSDGKDKETKGDLRIASPGKNEQSRHVPEKIPSIAPQPKNSADVLQQKLQQKFAAQRRKEMLAMQAGQDSKAVEENEGLLKARSVPKSTKQKTNKSNTRAERIERRRKVEKAALGKKAAKRSKRGQSKPIEVQLNQVADITTSAEPQPPNEALASIEASVGKGQETLGADDKEANDNDSKGKVPEERRATAQKLDDIMDILESSKNQKKPANLVTGGRKGESSSINTKPKPAGVESLNGLPNSGENPNIDSGKAAAMFAHYNNKLLAHLKANPEEISGSLHELGLLHSRLLGGVDSLVRKVTNDGPPNSSTEIGRRKTASTLSFRKHMTEGKENIPTNTNDSVLSAQTGLNPSFISLQAALGQNSEKVEGANLDSTQISASENVRKARASPRSPSKKARTTKTSPESSIEKAQKSKVSRKSPIEKATASDLEIMPVKVDQPSVPSLAYGLERVLFNPGVYQLQDPRSRVYNFDPYLQKIMPVAEFDFSALKEYITSSRDQSLIEIAKEHGKRYMGSTSSMTEVLSHFHFLLSQWRPINPSILSKSFPAHLTSFAEFQRTPSAIFLRWKDGSYAIDADKQFASANVLSMLGKSMEKLLTLSTDDFERYRKSNLGQVTEDEQFAPESYHYSTLGDFLMRSQLDAHDPRLPGTGMFDLKTRSVVSIRMDVANYEHGVGYEIKSRQGEWESYEREYYDMIRNAFLKYSLQVRMGRMDGIFVAFHNIERIFGFQYISLPEMDSTIHGQWDTSIGDQEFRLSLDLMNKVLDRATKKYPETSLRLHFETRDVQTPFMYIFAEPVTEEQVEEIQSQNNAKIQEFERKILGLARGNASQTDDTQEDDTKWENIQADVQEAMSRDELSVDEPGQDQESIDDDAGESGFAPSRPEVFEQGPLYAVKRPASVDDDVIAASAGNEEEDDDSEDDDDIDPEEDREDEANEEDGDRDAEEDGELEKHGQQEEVEEFQDVRVNTKADDRFEAEPEVDGDGVEENDAAPSGDHPVEVENGADSLTEARNKDDTPGVASGQERADEARESTNAKGETSISPGVNLGGAPEEEGHQKYQAQADQRFLDSIALEGAQAEATAKASSPEDILAMTLTLRNKVNGEYVLRPANMTAADEWSIEYSLIEVSEQSRARALYKACQRRRSKKKDVPLVAEDADIISDHIRRLREMSAKGRAWRKEQDKRDRALTVQVL